MGKIGIAFFALVSLWLLWRCIIRPLWGNCIRKIISFAPMNTAQGIGKFFLMVILLAVIVALLHIVGLGVFELTKPFLAIINGEV